MRLKHICLLVSLCIALSLTLSSCKQTNRSVSPNDTAINSNSKINSLIAKGKKLESASIDSLPDISKQLQQSGSLSNNKLALVYAKLFTAHYLWESADHIKAMQTAVDCLSDADKWKINSVMPELYALIANLHKENTNYKMAFSNVEKGLNIATANRDTIEIIALLSLNAMFTHSLWMSEHRQSVDKSLEYEMQALKIAQSDPKYERMCIRLYDNISQNNYDHKNYDQSILYGNKSVPLAIKYNQQRSLTYAYCWLGKAWYANGDRERGLDYLNNALQIAYKLNEPYRRMEIYMALYDCYLSASEYKQAIDYSTKFRQLHDSLQVQVNTKQIGELQIKYETVKKDKEIDLLDRSDRLKNREIFWILTGALLFILFLVVLLIQSRVIHRNNQIIKASNAQLNNALKNIAYIQSHELRKPLASILGLINVIRSDDYKADKDTLHKLEDAALDLDVKIQSINSHTQTEQDKNEQDK